MKRIVMLLLCLVLMISMVACKNNPDEPVTGNNGNPGNTVDPGNNGSPGTSDSDLLDLNICKFAGFHIGKPKLWMGKSDGDGNYYYKDGDFFFASGYLNEYSNIKLCDNLKETIAACEENLKYGIASFTGKYYRTAMEQIVESQTEVEVNGYKMLKVKGRIEGERNGPQCHYFVGYYVLFENSRFNNGNPYPIYWLGFTDSEGNLPTMEKYVDAAARSLKQY